MMRATIQPGPIGDYNGRAARVWYGRTDRGVRFLLYAVGVVVPTDEPQDEFLALTETEAPPEWKEIMDYLRDRRQWWR